MTNMGFNKFCEENDMHFVSTKVGDRYVLEAMMQEGYNIGGEQSGHIILLDYATTGDGQLSGAMILSIMKRTGEKLSQLAKIMERLPQVLINVKVSREGKLSIQTGKSRLKSKELAKSSVTEAESLFVCREQNLS